MTRWPLVALLSCCASLPVAAGDHVYSTDYSDCMGRAGGVTVDVLQCIAAETSRHDARLNETYRALRGQFYSARLTALVAAQRLWMQYRDANCSAYAYPDGGTPAAIHRASCLLEMTAERASELERLS